MAKKKPQSESESESDNNNSQDESEQSDSNSVDDNSHNSYSDNDSNDDSKPATTSTTPTNKITQLAYTANKDAKNPKGKKKEIKRLRRWLTFAKRKILLTLDDLGEVRCRCRGVAALKRHFLVTNLPFPVPPNIISISHTTLFTGHRSQNEQELPGLQPEHPQN